MLAKALQRANTAVLLDTAHNFEGAVDSYSDACTLLQQVILRSPEDQDRLKLEAIVSEIQYPFLVPFIHSSVHADSLVHPTEEDVLNPNRRTQERSSPGTAF
jgi:hypothetical protein